MLAASDPTAQTHILIAADHPIVLSGLRRVLEAQRDFEIIAEAHDGIEAVQRALTADVDLAVLDVSMPCRTGLQAAREIAQRKPAVRILMLSIHDSEQYVFEAVAVGAVGYVLTTSVDRDLVTACRAALRGEPFLYPAAIQAPIREHLQRLCQDTDRLGPLTPRYAVRRGLVEP